MRIVCVCADLENKTIHNAFFIRMRMWNVKNLRNVTVPALDFDPEFGQQGVAIQTLQAGV